MICAKKHRICAYSIKVKKDQIVNIKKKCHISNFYLIYFYFSLQYERISDMSEIIGGGEGVDISLKFPQSAKTKK